MIELLTLLFLQIDLDDEKLLISLYFDLSSDTFLQLSRILCLIFGTFSAKEEFLYSDLRSLD